ncbi:exopolysaccharide biosynthesis protein [Hypericibacter sp.]|uniref:exopolysaccharide biosynthesis protein n=1 Tax=Hypericibacter sp. TaxID=2705401 RepID=UPI003D6CCCD8
MTADSTPHRSRASSRRENSAKRKRPPRRGTGRPESVSRLLVDFGKGWKAETIAIGELMSALEHRGYGMLLILFALPNLIPNPIPGLSAIFGVPLAILSVQIILQRPHPWLPSWLAKRDIKREAYQRIVDRAAPSLTKIERILKPRLPIMLEPPAMSLIAGLCLVLSLLLILPIPLTGMVLAAPVVLFGLALMQRDGFCALVAALLGNAAMIFAIGAGWAAIRGVAAAVPN